MTHYMQHEGRSISIAGYACTWRTLSHRDPGNRRNLFLPGAFRDVLIRPSRSIECRVHHAGPGAVIGSIRDSNLEIWEDDFGLAFCVDPVPVTSASVSIIQSIVAGWTRGASTRATVAEREIQTIDGEEVVVITRMESLLHVAPVSAPMDEATAVWCSHEVDGDLPGYLRPVAARWAESRPGADPPKGFSERGQPLGCGKLKRGSNIKRQRPESTHASANRIECSVKRGRHDPRSSCASCDVGADHGRRGRDDRFRDAVV